MKKKKLNVNMFLTGIVFLGIAILVGYLGYPHFMIWNLVLGSLTIALSRR